jgi:alpha-galactosidase
MSNDPAFTFARAWRAAILGEAAPAADAPFAAQTPCAVPFAFRYDGTPSSALLPQWAVTREAADGVERVTWTAPDGLAVTLHLTAYPDFPVLNWVVTFTHTGEAPTAILEDIQALDVPWAAPQRTEWWGTFFEAAQVYRSLGSHCGIDDFLYQETTLADGGRLEMVAGGGRSSNQWLPFHNLVVGGVGVLTAIGWTGQWACTLTHADGAVRVRAGLELTHLRLLPGETIRTPRIMQLCWHGDRQAAHNQWRRFLLARHIPPTVKSPLTCAHWGGLHSDGHLARIAVYKRARLDYDYYWIDAGWYGPATSYSPDEHEGDWYQHTGNWSVNPAAHPDGLRPISDAAKDAGMDFLLWVEPERAKGGTPWTVSHPEFFLGDPQPGADLLLNLGDPAARAWLTDYMVGLIAENNIGCYRQDFNCDPLNYWRANDAPDRQGMTEIRYVEGLYAFWDALLASKPGLLIDNCSSGGRRIDIETMSRSIPLWRSDWQCWWTHDPIGSQVHGMGLAYWAPLHGTGVWGALDTGPTKSYRVRSALGPAMQFSIFPYEKNRIDPAYPWAWHRKMLRDYYRARPLFLGDYYPLTTLGADPAWWAAYQYHRPDLGAGFVLALRRRESPFRSAAFPLHGLEPDAVYLVEDADTGRSWRLTGAALATDGLPIALGTPNASRLVWYTRA